VLFRQPAAIRPTEITSKENYLDRRRFMAGGLALTSTLAAPALAATIPPGRGVELDGVAASRFSTDEAPNSFEDISTYNNYYEFGTDKSAPSRNA